MAKQTLAHVDTSELIDIVKDLRRYGQKEVVKVITKVNRSISTEIRDKSRAKAQRSNVPLASKSSKGITATASATKAGITLTRSTEGKGRYPTLFMINYGARYWHVPNPPAVQAKYNKKTRPMMMDNIGRLPASKPGAKRLAKKWLGNRYDAGDNPSWSTFGKEGYVVEKVIEQQSEKIFEEYSDRVHRALIKAVN